MKVLICALGMQEDIKRAFNSVADVIYWDWTKHVKSFNASLTYLVDQHQPDIVFMQIQTPGIINEETAKYISKKSKVINWTGDVRQPTPKWFLDIGRHIHLTLFTNMYDVDFLKAMEIRSEYLQIGFPDEIFNPEGPVKANAPEIVFMGNNIGGFPLSDMRLDMVRSLKIRYGDRFGYYGINWGRGIRSITDQHEEAAYYRGAKIAINLSHFNLSRYSSDRLLRAMGAGCMTLSHDYIHYWKDFTEAQHFDVWKDFDELHFKIDFYLRQDNTRRMLSKIGAKYVHESCTWFNRVHQLMEMI